MVPLIDMSNVVSALTKYVEDEIDKLKKMKIMGLYAANLVNLTSDVITEPLRKHFPTLAYLVRLLIALYTKHTNLIAHFETIKSVP